jgi:hypothetical protein
VRLAGTGGEHPVPSRIGRGRENRHGLVALFLPFKVYFEVELKETRLEWMERKKKVFE